MTACLKRITTFSFVQYVEKHAAILLGLLDLSTIETEKIWLIQGLSFSCCKRSKFACLAAWSKLAGPEIHIALRCWTCESLLLYMPKRPLTLKQEISRSGIKLSFLSGIYKFNTCTNTEIQELYKLVQATGNLKLSNGNYKLRLTL